jgi:dipeptidyl aminopeptidase/acylaminoacyl peptidase
MIKVFSLLKKIWWILVILLALFVVWCLWGRNQQVFLSPEAPWIQVEKPLEKYSFRRLRDRVFTGSEIELGKILSEQASYISRVFYYQAEGKRISGQINNPNGTPPAGGWPVVVMIRGYVAVEDYAIGTGTRNAAGYFASQGFMTLAPDFLGFGESDMPPENPLQERLLRPAQVLELIASIKNLSQANPEKVFMWGHSNGGQIALSVLEISGKKIPTTLWAPVSKPFPYSILYYTDEFDDYGKALRKELAGFEAQYDADEYSIHKFYDWIKAPIQIHQGTADDAVPLEWSRELEKNLNENGVAVQLYVYPGADHNLVGPTSPGLRGASPWDEAVERDKDWFSGFLGS